MERSIRTLLLLAMVLPLVGCAYCANTFDTHYEAEGGVWDRHNPTEGRVGSAFSDAGAPIGEPTNAPVPTEAEVPPEAYYEAIPVSETPTYRLNAKHRV